MRPCRWHFWLIVAQLLIVAANVGIVLWVEDNPRRNSFGRACSRAPSGHVPLPPRA
jgi:hypothetical protein